VFFDESSTRKNFTLKTKRVEWLKAAGEKGENKLLKYLTEGKIPKLPLSKCRECKISLKWGDRTYNFDHKDNNPNNNSQNNCYLVCRNCHGKATKIEKHAVRDIFGGIIEYKTIKRKVSYKKPKGSARKNTSARGKK
jgi:hypothetical protein